MMVVWLVSADAQREKIVDDLEMQNPQAAEAVDRRIIAATAPLGRFPEVGRVGRVAGTRELVVDGIPYVVVYRIKPPRVEILAVRHTSRLWPEELAGLRR